MNTPEQITCGEVDVIESLIEFMREDETHIPTNYELDLVQKLIAHHQSTRDMYWRSVATQAKFWTKAFDNGYCWEWQGSKNKDGYGVFRLDDKQVLSHRLSFGLLTNKHPNELDVIAHHCDNPLCINPDHLFETDQQGNMTDMKLKGRANGTGRSSKYRGVYYRKDVGRWRCMIRHQNKYIACGNYENETDAAQAFDREMIKLFGDKCVNALNFPELSPLPTPPSEGE